MFAPVSHLWIIDAIVCRYPRCAPLLQVHHMPHTYDNNFCLQTRVLPLWQGYKSATHYQSHRFGWESTTQEKKIQFILSNQEVEGKEGRRQGRFLVILDAVTARVGGLVLAVTALALASVASIVIAIAVAVAITAVATVAAAAAV